MAVGDATQAQGWPIVPETGEAGRARWGAKEINVTRDLIAGVKQLVPVGAPAFRTAAGITSGTAEPAGGNNGDVYFKIIL